MKRKTKAPDAQTRAIADVMDAVTKERGGPLGIGAIVLLATEWKDKPDTFVATEFEISVGTAKRLRATLVAGDDPIEPDAA